MLIGGIALIWLVSYGIWHIAIDQILAALLVIALTTFFSRKSIKLIADVVLEQAEAASGTLITQIFTHDVRTFAGMMGEQYANGTIGTTTFHLSVATAKSLQGKDLRIFYTSRSRRALSGEFLPTSASADATV